MILFFSLHFYLVFFFFSSRRRHTRYWRDWSSDVCSSDLQSEDDALRATQETEPVAVLVLRDLADELTAVLAQTGDDSVDVVDGEHDATHEIGRASCRERV